MPSCYPYQASINDESSIGNDNDTKNINKSQEKIVTILMNLIKNIIINNDRLYLSLALSSLQ